MTKALNKKRIKTLYKSVLDYTAQNWTIQVASLRFLNRVSILNSYCNLPQQLMHLNDTGNLDKLLEAVETDGVNATDEDGDTVLNVVIAYGNFRDLYF